MSKAVAIRGVFVASLILLALSLKNARAQQSSVLSYHGAANRNCNFVVPNLTWDRAGSVRLDSNFRAQVSGHVYAQPLYWRAPNPQSGGADCRKRKQRRRGNRRPLGKCNMAAPVGQAGRAQLLAVRQHLSARHYGYTGHR